MILGIERAVTDALTRDLVRRARRQARARAMKRFARRHPRWHRSLFDEVFVRSLAGDPADYDAAALADAWTRQFRYRNEAGRVADARALRPIARSYLALLEDEGARLGLRGDAARASVPHAA